MMSHDLLYPLSSQSGQNLKKVKLVLRLICGHICNTQTHTKSSRLHMYNVRLATCTYVCKYAPAYTTLQAESLRTNKLLAHKIKSTHIFELIGLSSDALAVV